MSKWDLAANGEITWDDDRIDRPGAGSAAHFRMAKDIPMHCFDCGENWVMVVYPGFGWIEGSPCPRCNSEETYTKEEKYIGYELKG